MIRRAPAEAIIAIEQASASGFFGRRREHKAAERGFSEAIAESSGRERIDAIVAARDDEERLIHAVRAGGASMIDTAVETSANARRAIQAKGPARRARGLCRGGPEHHGGGRPRQRRAGRDRARHRRGGAPAPPSRGCPETRRLRAAEGRLGRARPAQPVAAATHHGPEAAPAAPAGSVAVKPSPTWRSQGTTTRWRAGRRRGGVARWWASPEGHRTRGPLARWMSAMPNPSPDVAAQSAVEGAAGPVPARAPGGGR